MILTFNISYCSNVIFRSQNKFVIYDPFRFVVQASGWMQLNYLVIFYRQIVSGSFQMSNLERKLFISVKIQI